MDGTVPREKWMAPFRAVPRSVPPFMDGTVPPFFLVANISFYILPMRWTRRKHSIATLPVKVLILCPKRLDEL